MTTIEILEHKILEAVSANGGELYQVGGAVRDKLLGLENKDFDFLVTNLEFSALQSALEQFARVDVVGASFGVFKVTLEHETVDVALPRTERSTGIHHRDFEVSHDASLKLEDDLARRDFTVNAMAFHVADGILIDPFNGQHDLEHRILRCVGNGQERFSEDPLRMLRAARFLAKLDFTPSLELIQDARASADLILSVAPERVQTELFGLLAAKSATGVLRALEFLRDTGLLERVLPEYSACIGYDQQNPYHHLTLENHMFEAVRYAVSVGASLNARVALLFHDIGKPRTQTFGADGVAHYYRHEDVGADMTREILERLRCSNDVLHSVVKLVREHMRPPKNSSDKTLRRFLNALGEDWRIALDVREADMIAHKAEVGFSPRVWVESILERCESFDLSVATFDERKLALSGLEIMKAFNLKPGAELGRLKKLAAQAVIDGELENRQDLILEWLKSSVR
jgi:tRNA nucleotidyltransferase (CCA-adding enzyme)